MTSRHSMNHPAQDITQFPLNLLSLFHLILPPSHTFQPNTLKQQQQLLINLHHMKPPTISTLSILTLVTSLSHWLLLYLLWFLLPTQNRRASFPMKIC